LNVENRQRVVSEMEQAVISQTATPAAPVSIIDYTQQPPVAATAYPTYSVQPLSEDSLYSDLRYSPYPESIRQSVIQPVSSQPTAQAPAPTTPPPEPTTTPQTPIDTDDAQTPATDDTADDDAQPTTDASDSPTKRTDDIIEDNDNEKGGATSQDGDLHDDEEVVISLH